VTISGSFCPTAGQQFEQRGSVGLSTHSVSTILQRGRRGHVVKDLTTSVEPGSVCRRGSVPGERGEIPDKMRLVGEAEVGGGLAPGERRVRAGVSDEPLEAQQANKGLQRESDLADEQFVEAPETLRWNRPRLDIRSIVAKSVRFF
jgi:hypothetical protein